MKIDRSCDTCEFCFPAPDGNGCVCAGSHYGDPVDESGKDQDCWSIGYPYWEDLIEKLNPEQKHIFLAPYPSMQKAAFKAAGVKNETEYLFWCIEQL